MKLLHTADWHLGKHLSGFSRLREQKNFIAELCEIADANKVDMVLICGDVYDSFNPPAKAEQLFYWALHKLSCGGERIVCIISGNHDSPRRLIAPIPLTLGQGIIIMGRPGYNIEEILSRQPGLQKRQKTQELKGSLDMMKHAWLGLEHEAYMEQKKQLNKQSEFISQQIESPDDEFPDESPDESPDKGWRIGQHRLIRGGRGYMELEIKQERIVLLTLPYPSENRLGRQLVDISFDSDYYREYSSKIGKIFNDLEQHYRSDTINIAMSHLYVAGGGESESERRIQAHGELAVSWEHLPKNSQYTALGHLHRSQPASRERNAYYAGSPLQYSPRESQPPKSVSLVELAPGLQPEIELIHLRNITPVEIWVVDGVEQAFKKCWNNRERKVWAYLKIRTDCPLLQSDINKIRSLKNDIISIIPLSSGKYKKEQQQEFYENLNIIELFAEYYRRKKDCDPDGEVMKMFARILTEERA